MIRLNRYKDGKRGIITMSYDDGDKADRRLVEIFNEYGIRGTFNLNSGVLGDACHLDKEEISSLFKNHEVATHTVSHPYLENCQSQQVIQEIMNDREVLESLCGYVIRGHAYPFGTYNEKVIDIIKNCGIAYARAVAPSRNFNFPSNYHVWAPTCHHNDCLEMAERFLEFLKDPWRTPLFFVWGHSYEFDRNDNWVIMENFCKKVARIDEVWYATNIEIIDYLTALKNLNISVCGKIVHNPSAMPLWISIDDETVMIKGGETINLATDGKRIY